MLCSGHISKGSLPQTVLIFFNKGAAGLDVTTQISSFGFFGFFFLGVEITFF